MSDTFPTRVLNYKLRSQTDFFRNAVNITKFDLNSLKYFASKVWNMIPIKTKTSLSEMFKNKITLEIFKNKISKWEPNDCDCKLCLYYLSRIRYANLVDD